MQSNVWLATSPSNWARLVGGQFDAEGSSGADPATALIGRISPLKTLEFSFMQWLMGDLVVQRVQCGKVCYSREGNVCNEALHVIGLYALGDKVSLPEGLGACEGWIKLSHGLGHLVPGIA